jgi:hypothetical protein
LPRHAHQEAIDMLAIRATTVPSASMPPQSGIGALLILLRRKAASALTQFLEAKGPKRRYPPEPVEEPDEEAPARSPEDYWNDPQFWMCMMPH